MNFIKEAKKSLNIFKIVSTKYQKVFYSLTTASQFKYVI